MGYQGNYPPSTPLTSSQIGTGAVTSDAIADGAVVPADLSTGAPSWDTSGNATVSGNLTLSGTGNRITGDMSNATFSSRLAFQSSTTNGNTNVTTLPNGTATSSGIQCYNAADPTNAAFANIGAGSTEIQFLSAVRGTGTYLPMTFYTNGSERMRIDTSGNVGVGTNSPSTILDIYSGTGANFSVRGDAGTNITASRYSTDANPPNINLRKGRGTNDSPTAVASNDSLGNLWFAAYGGANFRNLSYVASRVSTYTSDTDISSFLSFGTSPSGSAAATERMRIDSSGNLLVGASSQIGSEKFNVTSGTTNATQYTTIATKGGSSFYIEQQQTTSVSTTATAILASPKYCTFCLVHGSDGTNRFSDVVLMSVGTGTVNVISSLSASGTPSARTYSQSSSTLRVAMGSGTYTVQATSLNMSS